MTIPGSGSPLLLRRAAGGYSIERSVRFNSSDSAYLSRTPASAGNRKTWTWAGWVKRSNLTNQQAFWSAGSTGTNRTSVLFDGSARVRFFNYAGSVNVDLVTTPVYRDASAWYHFVIAVDTTQGTASNRIKLYVNGVQVTAFSTSTYPSSNQDLVFNSAIAHGIGRGEQAGGEYLSAYLADVFFVDGQALDPTSFGEFDDNGIWQPIEYSGSFGTNGFHLPFDDNSTAAALGTDTSGNGNTWTVNNISVAAGAGNDSLVDVPTNGTASSGGDAGGVVRGNYCTLNPLATAGSMTNGNLDGVNPNNTTTHATFAIPSSGKWYFEAVMTNAGVLNLGLAAYRPSGHVYTITNSVLYSSSGVKNVDGVLDQAYGASFSSGDVIGVACDADAGTITFYKNNSSQGALTHQIGGLFPSFGNGGVSTNYTVNFGQRPFAYTAPSGFKALCDTNLPAPVVAQPSTVMDVKLYTGNGSTQTISGLGFSPDLVWIKSRSNTLSHFLVDTVRGNTKELYSNATNAESTNTTTVTAFNSDGFDLGSRVGTNESGGSYVTWTWDAGTTTASNTDGSISSQVRANASAGFSIVTYTGTGSNATVGHGLGVAPDMVIYKTRTGTASNWIVYHRTIGGTGGLQLNVTSAAFSDSTPFNGTNPTSTVLHVGTNYQTNSAVPIVAYCFAPVAGYSSFGSYGAGTDPFVYLGFRPAFLMIKRSNGTENWNIVDNRRNAVGNANVVTYSLQPNSSGAEYQAEPGIDLLSNGFKLRGSFNSGGGTYIYAAFAESPFQYARAR